jgi:pimeloyl-ACP methyl ester carboxylesterase
MKPAIVLIHGSGGSARRWERQTRYLSERGYRALAVDLPGHGQTPGPSSSDIGVYADYVEALLEAEGIEQPVVGGHSMGGGVAMTLALRHPTAWSGLILMGTAARLRLLPSVFDDIRLRFDASVETMVRAVYATKTAPELLEWAASELREIGPATLLNDYQAFEGFDVRKTVSGISIPTLIIVGREDLVTAPMHAEFLHRSIAHSTLECIDGAGHMAMLEQPARVNEALLAFLETLEVRERQAAPAVLE